MRAIISWLMILSFLPAAAVYSADEVNSSSRTVVRVKNHSRTGLPYTVIAAADASSSGVIVEPMPEGIFRPDYRMLEKNTRPSEVAYNGPVSDRKKIYYFAAGLATLGAVGSAALPVAAVSSSSAGGGAGLLAGSGVAVAAGTYGTVELMKNRNEHDDLELKAESTTADEPSEES